MNDMKSVYLAIIALCFIAFPGQAQNANDSILLKRELTLEREYNPDIDNATKVNQLPELRAPQAQKSPIEFSNYATPYSTSPNLNYLPARAYASEIAKSKKIGYLTAGISTLVDIDGDLGVQIMNTPKDFLSVYASHRSSNSNVNYIQEDGKQKMKLNDNWGGILFSHDFEKFKLNLGAKYTYSAFNYYGQADSYTFSQDAPVEMFPMEINKDKNQINNLFEVNAGATSSSVEDLSWLLNFSYRFFNQKYGTDYINNEGRKENQFRINGGAAYKFNDDFTLGLLGKLQNFSYSSIPPVYKDDWWGNLNYSTISLNPYIKMEGSNWNLRVGINEEIQLGKRKEANFSPDVYFDFTPNKMLVFEFSATGGIKENSNYSMFYENRYINPSLRVSDSRVPLDINLGLNFLVMDNLKLKLFGGYEIIKDEHFYASIYNPSTYWEETHVMGHDVGVIYENVNLFKAGFSVDYFYQNILEFKLKGIYNKWEEKDRADFVPYGRPNFIGDLNIAYKMEELPIRIDGYYHLENGRKFWKTENKNNSINDLSVKGTYLLNDMLSFYLKANNLLFQKYEFWQGYPAQNFNIMGGVSVKF